MDETAHTRAAFLEGIDDITPPALRSRLEDVLASASITPGGLVVLTATTLDESVEPERAATRGAGVQMSYEGLRLSRDLIHTDPWVNGDRDQADLNAIAAEVLVARGFEYLAHTGVAMDVVDAVRHFGRDQTYRETDSDPEAFDTQLEGDFVRIGLKAGVDIALGSIPETAVTVADELADELGQNPLPEADTALVGIEDRITTAIASADTAKAERFSKSSGT